jgi:hypothetical protein
MKTSGLSVNFISDVNVGKKLNKLIKLLNSSVDVIGSEINDEHLTKIKYHSYSKMSRVSLCVSYDRPTQLKQVVNTSLRIVRFGERFIEPSFKLTKENYDDIIVTDEGFNERRWDLTESFRYSDSYMQDFIKKGKPFATASFYKYYGDVKDLKADLNFADSLSYVKPVKLFDYNGYPVLSCNPHIKLQKVLDSFDEKNISDLSNKIIELNDAFMYYNSQEAKFKFYLPSLSLYYPIHIPNQDDLVAKYYISLKQKSEEFVFNFNE